MTLPEEDKPSLPEGVKLLPDGSKKIRLSRHIWITVEAGSAFSPKPWVEKKPFVPPLEEQPKPKHSKEVVRRPAASNKKAAPRKYRIGEMVPEEGGVYFGQIKLEGLSKTFNMFAAPEDLPETMTYVNTVKHVAGLKGWNGFDGTNYENAKEFYTALKNGSYKGGWIVPTREMLIGTEADGPNGKRASTTALVQPDNLYDHREKGALKGTFCTKAARGSDFPQWYWSCTELREDPDYAWDADFSDGDGDWYRKDDIRFSCRLVRLVECKAG